MSARLPIVAAAVSTALARLRAELVAAAPTPEHRDAVNERIRSTHEDYTTAWENTKRLKPELFAAMK